MTDADIIVIGSGQAGVALAARLVTAGKRVVLAEKGPLGGTCVNTGCTPTKTMVASARAAHVARTAPRLGVHTGEVHVDLAAVVARKDGIVKRWRDGVDKRLASAGVTVARGHARFVAAKELDVGGTRYRAPTIVINVGAKPVAPPIPGLDGVPWLDNDTVMRLTELPSHLLVIGGGYIGCEFGQMFRRFGARVTILDAAPHLVSREDDDVCAAIEGVFRAEGIELVLGTNIDKVGTDGGDLVVTAGGKTYRGSHLLVATGRRPSTEDLGCEVAGIALDGKGHVVADDHYKTSVDGVYAVGDCIDQPQFTHVAWDDHRLLFDALISGRVRSRGRRTIPYTTYVDPQVAGVGLTEKEAKRHGVAYEVATMPFGAIARATEVDETAGLLKVLVDPKTEKLVGAAIVGAEAGELIHVFLTMIEGGVPARVLVDAEMVHPAFAEGLQSVLMRLDRFAPAFRA
jgi:pyruvate/2-oxoglutarate dehydrogenase complex dihydrolipoamide dehydrogenase (E3) component